MAWFSDIFGTNNKKDNPEPLSFTIRLGKSVPTDEAFEAWTSGTIEDMIKASNSKTNPIDRHFLLQSIVAISYKLRRDEKYRRICVEYSEKHLAEFPQILPVLKEELNGVLPRISTFQDYATILTENGEFERAISICDMALSYGLQDGTKSGYSGRKNRILDKMTKSRFKA